MTAVLVLSLISCDDNDNNTQQPNVDSNLWSTTYSHANLGAYPDIYSKYWVYAYDITDNPNVGLRPTWQEVHNRRVLAALQMIVVGSVHRVDPRNLLTKLLGSLIYI